MKDYRVRHITLHAELLMSRVARQRGSVRHLIISSVQTLIPKVDLKLKSAA